MQGPLYEINFKIGNHALIGVKVFLCFISASSYREVVCEKRNSYPRQKWKGLRAEMGLEWF